MGMRELSIDLTDEQKAIRDATHKFSAEVLRPAAIELDKLNDPQDVADKGSMLWDAFRKAYQLGYNKTRLPKALGGLELDALSVSLVSEQMGWGAADFAIGIGVSSFPFRFAALSQDPAVQALTRQFCEDTEAKMVGCWAITEPNHGSDWILFDGENSTDPKCAPSVRAVEDGDVYVVNGQKSAWVSNGTIATHAALFLSMDPSAGMRNSGIAVVPLDLPGISRGKPLDKLGQRALNQGEIFFDDVRIPKGCVVCKDPETFQVMAEMTLTAANAGMGSTFVGVAQSAYDEAIQYAKERVQGGKPIIEHQNIQLKLFDMFTSVEAARSLARRVVVYNESQTQENKTPALHYSIASKILATETSFRVASEAIQILGGVGLSREYPIEKIFRDARAATIEDGVNDVLALAGAARL
jgi:alkylation response protein AidB-like acyl-CoA dehydrogenase